METTLHRQLKALYAGRAARCEQWVDGYRIDAISRGRLIEIQQASLSAIRSKVRTLTASHSVLVVKPLVSRKRIIRQDEATSSVISTRFSPQQETVWNLFLDLVHFTDVFPHPKLTLEAVLTEVDEYRIDRPQRRRRRKQYLVADRCLTQLGERFRFRTASDLLRLLPTRLGDTFTTADLATAVELPRWWAQKIAYCLRQSGAITAVGKARHSWLYARVARRRAA